MDFQRQCEILENIEKIKVNFKKDSDHRKTAAYLQTRLNAPDTYWNEFDQNHAKLLALEGRDHEYFKKDMFTKARATYEQIRQLIATYPPTSNPSPDAESSGTALKDSATASKTDELKSQQRTNFRAFLRLVRGMGEADKITEKWELEDKLQMLQNRWKIIDELHWKIDNILVGLDAYYELEFAEHEKSYEDMKKKLNQKLSNAIHQQLSTPKVDIPTFLGNYTQWPTFMDIFCGAIHNNPALSKAQKMQYLKGKLKGEAERLVQHLNISTENYDTCWELLTHRYNNIQILFTKQIQTFMYQPFITKQSSVTLKQLHDTTMETIHAIHNLGVDTTSWDPLLVTILSEKLDPVTFADYMEARKTPRDLPSFEEFMTFIEGKFTALEPVKYNSNKPDIINKGGNSSTFKQNQF